MSRSVDQKKTLGMTFEFFPKGLPKGWFARVIQANRNKTRRPHTEPGEPEHQQDLSQHSFDMPGDSPAAISIVLALLSDIRVFSVIAARFLEVVQISHRNVDLRCSSRGLGDT